MTAKRNIKWKIELLFTDTERRLPCYPYGRTLVEALDNLRRYTDLDGVCFMDKPTYQGAVFKGRWVD